VNIRYYFWLIGIHLAAIWHTFAFGKDIVFLSVLVKAVSFSGNAFVLLILGSVCTNVLIHLLFSSLNT
jgi:hypothetical protein